MLCACGAPFNIIGNVSIDAEPIIWLVPASSPTPCAHHGGLQGCSWGVLRHRLSRPPGEYQT